MRWPIRYQILVPFTAVMLAAVVGISVLNAYWAASNTQREIETRLRGVASTLLLSNFPLTEKVLEQMGGLSGAEFVLTDQRASVLATTGPRVLSPPAEEQIVDRWQDLRLGQPLLVDQQRYFYAVLRTDRRGRADEPLLLHVLFPESVLRQARRQAALPPLVVGGVALVMCIALASVLARGISLPILRIRSQVVRLAAGEYQPLRIPPRDDELRELATSVNQLARELDDVRRAIVRSERLSLLGRLSGGLAHNLRNDITGARMAVQMHRRHCATIDQESLDVALRQLSLTEEHLQRFLAAGQPQQPCRTQVDLRQVVEDLIALMSPAAAHRHVSLAVSCNEKLQTIFADRDQLRQAIMNLMLNAIEAAAKDGWVRVELDAEDGRAIVRVIDSGAGLPPAMLQRWGEAFATTKPEGVGLGLAVAKQIATAHGGGIRYARSDEVTCFELSLRDDNERVAKEESKVECETVVSRYEPEPSV